MSCVHLGCTQTVFMNNEVFENFPLHESILRAVREEGYRRPTEIQQAAIPEILAGRDVLAAAKTGTGKTAAFSLPMLEMLQSRRQPGPSALVLTPTRELALQVETNIRAYGKYLALKTIVIVGGV